MIKPEIPYFLVYENHDAIKLQLNLLNNCKGYSTFRSKPVINLCFNFSIQCFF